MNDPSIKQIPGLSAIAGAYRGVLSDVWGVIQNGVTAYEEACAALTRYREAGGAVVLITNAARPNDTVRKQLDGMGVPGSAYDDIVTSGDVTRELLVHEGISRAFHIGTDRDLPLFEATGIDRVGLDEAEIIVCTGLFDDRTETPGDYRERFEDYISRGLRFLCANPDIVVDVGGTLLWCAGALAREYTGLGGEVILLGKPHPPIYRAAKRRLEEITESKLERADILTIGDGLPTDIAGAVGEGLPALFISSGIHAADFGDVEAPDIELIERRLNAEGAEVIGTMPRLRW